MADFKLEKRVYCKIRSKLGFSATDIHADLQKVYEEYAVQYGAVAKWVRRCKDGFESVEDDERTGRPVAATSEKEIYIIKELIHVETDAKIHGGRTSSGISSSTVQYSILTDHPHLLTHEQKEKRVEQTQ